MSRPDLPIRAATETVLAHGITPDRCDILQDSSTLVLRLTETLVARVVQDVDGPRQGTEWFARENAIALHLTQQGAPSIPLHPDLPPGPHEHFGFPMNFWLYVTAIEAEPSPEEVGRTLQECHAILRSFDQPLPRLAIVTESLALLEPLERRDLFPAEALELLRRHLTTSLEALDRFPHQPLHGDAHLGNLMNTTSGLLWTDWEDSFAGPVEWDVASVIWNAKLLEDDHETVNRILAAYRDAGGVINEEALHHCLIARAAVISAWYPILYPRPDAERQSKLQRRLDWLASV
ncbi:aminoglycoside phosphotransferase family protein [Prosthecobacter sp. SYSU 5D2]|uniref:aminoglycoside phosphotransferase family protein n=1 Tax=Prosthecobacter sp. SYSU 5D2 TaxID=3134134 RepID=UPI0031FF1D25